MPLHETLFSEFGCSLPVTAEVQFVERGGQMISDLPSKDYLGRGDTSGRVRSVSVYQ